MTTDTDRINIILADRQNQTDWQRHNENQRAQLSSILLAISAALVTLLPKDRPLTHDEWPVPAFLVGLGIFGILAVMKYWERFTLHSRLEHAHRKTLEVYFENDNHNKPVWEAIEKHNKGWRPLLKDRHLMQHWLWEGVFTLITLLGIYFLLKIFTTP